MEVRTVEAKEYIVSCPVCGFELRSKSTKRLELGLKRHLIRHLKSKILSDFYKNIGRVKVEELTALIKKDWA